MKFKDFCPGQTIVLGPCEREEYKSAMFLIDEDGGQYVLLDGELPEGDVGLIMDEPEPDEECRLASPEELELLRKKQEESPES